MINLFTICLIAGLAFLVISLVFDILGGVLDFLAIDLPNFDLGDMTIGFLPLSLIALSMGSVTFGALGLCLSHYLSVKFTFAISLFCGYFSAVVVQTVILKLKRLKNEAEEVESILKRDAFVATKIKKDGFGSISLVKDDGSVVSFPAKSVDNIDIPQDTAVQVESQKNGIVYVSIK